MIESSASVAFWHRSPAVRFAQWAVGATIGGLLLFSLLIFVRRISGGLTSPLDAGELILAASVLAAVSGGLRRCWAQATPVPRGPLAVLLVLWLPSLSLLILAVSLTLPASPTNAIFLFWIILITEEAVSFWHARRTGPWFFHAPPREQTAVCRASHNPRRRDATQLGRQEPREAADLETISPPENATQMLAGHVSQQLTRFRDPTGNESVHGLLRGTFAEGQRSLSLHVAFCPPFERTPDLQTDQLDGPTAQIKIAQLMPYGVRIDLRLQSYSRQTESVVIQMHACALGDSKDSRQEN